MEERGELSETFMISRTPSFGLPLQFGQVFAANILYLQDHIQACDIHGIRPEWEWN